MTPLEENIAQAQDLEKICKAPGPYGYPPGTPYTDRASCLNYWMEQAQRVDEANAATDEGCARLALTDHPTLSQILSPETVCKVYRGDYYPHAILLAAGVVFLGFVWVRNN